MQGWSSACNDLHRDGWIGGSYASFRCKSAEQRERSGNHDSAVSYSVSNFPSYMLTSQSCGPFKLAYILNQCLDRCIRRYHKRRYRLTVYSSTDITDFESSCSCIQASSCDPLSAVGCSISARVRPHIYTDLAFGELLLLFIPSQPTRSGSIRECVAHCHKTTPSIMDSAFPRFTRREGWLWSSSSGC